MPQPFKNLSRGSIMKAVFAVLFLVAGVTANAANTVHLARHSSSGFFAPPSIRGYTSCDVYSDKVVLTKYVGTVGVTKTIAVELKGDIATLVSQASTGKITQSVGPQDGPVSSDVAYLNGGNDEKAQVVLVSGGSLREKNESPAAVSLIKLLDLVCE
jgi:hypothetical protein